MSKTSFTILIAEDDSRTRQALTSSLETAGYQVIAAVDGHEALELFRTAERVDLVILDVLMPRLNGFEVCRRMPFEAEFLYRIACVGQEARAKIGVHPRFGDNFRASHRTNLVRVELDPIVQSFLCNQSFLNREIL